VILLWVVRQVNCKCSWQLKSDRKRSLSCLLAKAI